MDTRNALLEKILAAIGGSEPAITTMINSRASLGNTVSADGVIGPIALTGTANEELPPPTVPQPPVGGNYNGYVEIGGFSIINQYGEVSVVGHEFVIGAEGAGDYRTPHAWLDIATSVNNNIIGFIFGVEKFNSGLVSFSQRVTGERGSAQDQATNISGGGFIISLEAGDKLSVWAASSLSCNLTIYDANLGLEMACPASLKL